MTTGMSPTLILRARTRRPAPLTVQLPDLETVPEPWRGAEYTVTKLLGDGDTNTKLAKSNAADTVYRTWGLALAPANESGYQVCSSASEGCRNSCIYRQGRVVVFKQIVAARIAKTIAWKEHKAWFLKRLFWELHGIAQRGRREGYTPAIRLNVTSDVMWEKEAPKLFEMFPSIQYYDYSKHYKRMLRWCKGELPSNYHLTFSRSEGNEHYARHVLDAGGNVTVVFRDKNFPSEYLGHRVINGDVTDMRFLDDENVVVGLYAKGTGRQDDTGFVVETATSERKVSLPLLRLAV